MLIYPSKELVRYIINGIFATLMHYLTLFISLEIIRIKSAGISNLTASIIGIIFSFLGNRYFVFKALEEPFLGQLIKFTALYLLIATIHGLTLFLWTDIYKLNYNYGFLIAVTIQFFMGYFLGKKYIFTS